MKTITSSAVALILFLHLALVISCGGGGGGIRVGDDSDPAAIANFTSAFGRLLGWTATGDDGNSGIVRIYDVRYFEDSEVAAILGVPSLAGASLASIQQAVQSNFDDATQVEDEPEPSAAGSIETFLFPRIDITGARRFFAAIIARDEVGNESSPSNVVEVSTPLVFAQFASSAGGSCFGRSIGGGDFNDDDISDVLIGDPCLGRVFVFYGRNDLATGSANGDRFFDVASGDTPDAVIIGNAADMFGASVSGIGTFMGDFADEIVIGAPGANGGAGAVFIITGESSDLVPVINLTAGDEADVIITGEAAGDGFGFTVSDGTGVIGGNRALLVGAPNALSQRGKAYVFRASSLNSANSAAGARVILSGEAAGDMFGFALRQVGNLDSGSTEELGVGAPGAGRAYVIFGSGDLASRDLSAGVSGVVVIQGASQFGFSIGGGADLDDPDVDTNSGNERDELIVGNPSGSGAVFIYSGTEIEAARTTGLSPSPLSQISGSGGGFGTSVAILADVNPDTMSDSVSSGFLVDFEPTNADFAVGAPGMSRVYLFFGRPNFPAALSAAQANISLPLAGDTAPGAGFGSVVVNLGDISDDSLPDIGIGGAGFVRTEF
ncbi:MAG: hypothetical protein ACT4NX_05700 [Deltaproteobacteria bacterium]